MHRANAQQRDQQPGRVRGGCAPAWCLVAVGLLLAAAPALAQEGLASGRSVLHEEWADAMHALLDPAEQREGAGHDDVEGRFAGLCHGDRDGRDARRRGVRVDRPRWQPGGDAPRWVVDVPESGFYSFRVHGAGDGRWLANRSAIAFLDPTPLGIDVAPKRVALERGRNELSAELAPGAAIERIELVPVDDACIAPRDGWAAGQPLRFGEKARTLVQTLGLEGRLPTIGDPIVVEGEHYLEVEGDAIRADAPPGATLSQDGWARVQGERATFEYRVNAPADGLYSLLVRMSGPGRQVFWVDDRWAAAVTPRRDPSGAAWAEALTVPLRRGEHTIRARAANGDGIDVLHLVRRRTHDQDYIDLLESFGVQEGAVDEVVTAADAERNLDAVAFGRFQLDPLSAELSLVEKEVEELYKRPLSPIVPGVP